VFVPSKEALFGVLICYEGIFAGISRRLAQGGAQFLVHITNDAWYGRSSAAYQHLALVVFRAVETRRAVGRAANTGISAFIDPTGRIRQPTGLFERTIVHGELPLLDEQTWYNRIGEAFVYLCLSGLLFCLGLSLWYKGPSQVSGGPQM